MNNLPLFESPGAVFCMCEISRKSRKYRYNVCGESSVWGKEILTKCEMIVSIVRYRNEETDRQYT